MTSLASPKIFIPTLPRTKSFYTFASAVFYPSYTTKKGEKFKNMYVYGIGNFIIGSRWKTRFFWLGHFDFFNIFLPYPYLNQSQINGVACMGLNCHDYYLWFPENSREYRLMRNTVGYSNLRFWFLSKWNTFLSCCL